MATVAHSTLTGAELHEPKGIAGQDAGKVYVSDGASSGAWAAVIPVGGVMPWAGRAAPTSWLLCYGQAVSRATYSVLFAEIASDYGDGDGSTTFNLPDCRGRAVFGQDDMGGVSADRLTGLTDGLDGDVLGDTGGTESETMSEAEMPGHSHLLFRNESINNNPSLTLPGGAADYPRRGNNQGEANQDAYDIHGSTGVPNIGVSETVGSGSAQNNVPPGIVLNYIIYSGV